MSELKTQLEYLEDTKELIKAALQSKGQAVSSSDTFRSYAEKIIDITDIVAEDLTISPSTNQQIIRPTGQYNSFSSVVVNPVTASIDSNIVANNIREGVTILGVTGTMAEKENLDTELNALETQVSILLNDSVENKTSSEMTQAEVDQAKSQIANLFGE